MHRLFAPSHIWLIVASLLLAGLLIKRAWRLRGIPGPFLTRFTDLLRVFHQARGNLLPWLVEIHAKHGTVVRIGPNCISVSDATQVPSIYTMHGEFRKVRSNA
jgi:hypothetical protein